MPNTTVTSHVAPRSAALIAISVWMAGSPSALAQTKFTADWSSIDTHTAAPEWFQDAKFGVYYHWGAFGTPMFGSEWYPRNMFNKGANSAEYQHQLSTYGDPFGNWGYDKFILGANDKSGKFVQFAPKLKADGGAWDPDEWAQLMVDSGARFAGPVAEHHDGFSHWDSKTNEWNANDRGPKINLVKLQVEAYRKKGLKVILTMHHQWHFDPTGYYQWAPVPSDPSLQKLYGKLPIATEQQIWSDKLKEIIDEFMPDIIWQDNYLARIPQDRLQNFLSYYYNAGIAAGKEVVATGKEGITPPTHKGQVLDYERGGPGDISTPYWLTDDAVSPSSWCYVQGMSYYTSAQEIHSFVDHVSKGGNLLLNISPMPDGTIPQQQRDILKAFGTFLSQAGEAIYATRPWAVYGEGPTKIGGGSFSGPKAMTATDVRYTKSKNGDAVYAIFGGWPSGQFNLTSVTTSRFALGSGKVYLFGDVGGSPTELQATQDSSGLHVTFPASKPYTAVAYAIKISPTAVPPKNTTIGNSTTDGGVPSTGGSGGTSSGGTTGTDAGSAAGGTTSMTSARGGATSVGGTAGSVSTAGSAGRGGNTAAGGAATSGGATSSSGGTTASGGQGAGGLSAAAGASSAGGASSGGTTGAGQGGAGGANTRTPPPESKTTGCSCNVQGSRRADALLVLLGWGLVFAARRRRR